MRLVRGLIEQGNVKDKPQTPTLDTIAWHVYDAPVFEILQIKVGWGYT